MILRTFSISAGLTSLGFLVALVIYVGTAKIRAWLTGRNLYDSRKYT